MVGLAFGCKSYFFIMLMWGGIGAIGDNAIYNVEANTVVHQHQYDTILMIFLQIVSYFSLFVLVKVAISV